MTHNEPADPITSPRLTQWVALFLLVFGGWNIVMATGAIVVEGKMREGMGLAALGIIIIALAVFLDRDRIRFGQLKEVPARDDQLM